MRSLQEFTYLGQLRGLAYSSTRPGYEVAVGFLSALPLPLILDDFVLLYTPRERECNNTLLRFAISASAI